MRTIGHVRRPNAHSQLLESVVIPTRTILNIIWKRDLDATQRPAGTQRNTMGALEMKIGATAIHDHALLAAPFLDKNRPTSHRLALENFTSPRECNHCTKFVVANARV